MRENTHCLKYQKKRYPKLEDTYNDYVADLCKFAVRHLPSDDSPDSLEQNFEFSVKFIKPPGRFYFATTDKWVWEVIWWIFADDGSADVTSRLINTFQPVLTNADRLRIFSRAALYFLQFLCDSNITKGEAKRHLKVVGLEKRRRNSSPWKWHRLTSAHKIPKNEKRLVLYKDYVGNTSENFCQSYALLPKRVLLSYAGIYSFASFDWKNVGSSWEQCHQRWYTYLSYLDYLVEILPLAGRYPPLIDLCKTKAFAPMSMMFPAISRRARRAIDKYLKRMELEDDAELQSQDNRYVDKFLVRVPS